ncbi:RNA polymerase sigma factor [Catenuloplanes atrovinosus]|uniref:RNA polymerase sigma-70 factor (ECF subfamily) n=1 Tax=Catenuloplanes atrovinosus TaxID=137266 RepID=A0AAE3YMM1_9ACTN|nr:DUF6596 domain-containing protein [Catenuloplanes atrovinosus]MDR7276559.1 RNA polymerase sigma-70 factor (ECF subfamily) [Catenuloplanes atrovinosus]
MADVGPRAVVEAVWRADGASMLGVLSRRLGDLDRAEEALQDAIAAALDRWPADGVPESPAGWLVTTAWRRALDRVRHEATARAKLPLLVEPEPGPPTGDDRLGLMFACCHPGLAVSAQVALTLHAVAGLPAARIGAAFLLPEATVAQRLVRAKRRLRDSGADFTIPGPRGYAERLAQLLQVIYLIYNEGYLERRELAREGLDLARQLAALLPGEPEAAGLAALVELHESRAGARFTGDGALVLLEDQDRARWDRALIGSAVHRLRAAMGADRPGPYQLQAAIATQHALARSVADTDWAAIRRLYDLLHAATGNPVVLLGRAVATRHTSGAGTALAEVDALAARLGEYRLFHATRAELLTALGRDAEAGSATRRALALATNPAERALLAARLSDR